MAKDCPRLHIHFYKNFPGHCAGEVVTLDPDSKNGCDRKTSRDSFWILGKITYSDIRILPPEELDQLRHYASLSRIHCTFKFDVKLQVFQILDGGTYLSETDTSPGEEIVTPSTNGVWVDGRRIKANDWYTLENGDRVHFGNDKRMIAYTVDDPTINEWAWEDSNWVCRGEKEVSDTPIPDSSELLKHAKSNANPESTTTSWGFFSRVFDWFVTPATTRYENLTKLFLVGFVSAFFFSDEFRQLVAWVFRH